MIIFEIKCACGNGILGPRVGGKARGEWLGYNTCTKCRKAEEEARQTAASAQGDAA